ncbi:MAG TPA: LysE family translocator [Acetobacteraceae bacterium]|nr:LysE family translocator [Acetobacteraceae bacterium]
MHIGTWIAFTLAYGLIAAAPGPMVLLVISYALSQGRRSSLAVIAGSSLGDSTCLAAALLGVGAILKASATAFLVLKLAGAAYLVFLGIRVWRAPPVLRDEAPSAPSPLGRVFVHSYLTGVFNPKSILFFMVFVPQFLDRQAPLLPQCVIMLATVLACAPLIDGGYSLFAGSLRRFIRTARAQRLVNRATGGLLVGEGILAATWRALAA